MMYKAVHDDRAVILMQHIRNALLAVMNTGVQYVCAEDDLNKNLGQSFTESI